jgi:anti-sigma regulatory factor (Ser/Thr protein kinase)
MPIDDRAQLAISLPPDPASVAQARRAVRDLAEQCGAEIDDVMLAVSEAVTNSIVHAAPGRRASIKLLALDEAGLLTVVVEDRGGGMRTDGASAGLGLGFAVIDQMSETRQTEEVEDGVRLEMTFACR